MFESYWLWNLSQRRRSINFEKMPEEEEKEQNKIYNSSIDSGDDFDDDVVEFTNFDFRFRKDVIYKRIARSWRKYYSKELQKYVGKTRQTFAKIKQDKQRISKYIKDFVKLQFGNEASKGMELLLHWFIDTQAWKFKRNSRYLKSEFLSMIYAFNIQKMIDWLKRKGFAKIMRKYLSLPNIISKVMKLSSDQYLVGTTQSHIEQILSICEKTWSIIRLLIW